MKVKCVWVPHNNEINLTVGKVYEVKPMATGREPIYLSDIKFFVFDDRGEWIFAPKKSFVPVEEV